MSKRNSDCKRAGSRWISKIRLTLRTAGSLRAVVPSDFHEMVCQDKRCLWILCIPIKTVDLPPKREFLPIDPLSYIYKECVLQHGDRGVYILAAA